MHRAVLCGTGGCALVGGLAAVVLGACGPPKQAEDPQAFIDEPEPREALAARPSRNRAGEEGREPQSAGNDAMANARECELAARSTVRVGIDQAIAAAEDDETRRRLQADRDAALHSQEAAAHVREMKDACLEHGMSRTEAACVAAAKDEAGIEACYPESEASKR